MNLTGMLLYGRAYYALKTNDSGIAVLTVAAMPYNTRQERYNASS